MKKHQNIVAEFVFLKKKQHRIALKKELCEGSIYTKKKEKSR